jgi:hypothetical protein
MKIRFQADADLNQIIVLATLRRETFHPLPDRGSRGIVRSQRSRSATKSRERWSTVSDARPENNASPFRGVYQKCNEPRVVSYTPASFRRMVVEDLQLIWFVTDPNEWITRINFLPL